MSAVIKVENLGKKYIIGHQRRGSYSTLRDDIAHIARGIWQRIWHPLSPNRESVDLEEIWALKDVSFQVEQGERLGIIGRNGAGKSTLLKILSRITEPTTGRLHLKGRVSSLLEVGTGFHPELTGRENIFLNGAILGMTKQEIRKKFDEIVAFSEIEKFLDTPVKRYSSGMYVRLAFAVAAHLEPEILIVDEVLAVGDAAFQKKCLGKMENVAKEGRTVLFVSHNMQAVARLCQSVIRLNEGSIVDQGDSQRVVENYLAGNVKSASRITLPPDSSKPMCLREVTILNNRGVPSAQVEMGERFRVRVEYDVNQTVNSAHVICFFHTSGGINVFGTGDADCASERLGDRPPGHYCGEFEVPAFLLGEGQYSITVSLGVPFLRRYDRHENVVVFEVTDNTSQRRQWQHRRRPGLLGLELAWYYRRDPVQQPADGRKEQSPCD